MSVNRKQVIDMLATCDPTELRLVLEAAAVPARGAEQPRELAERIANALWWSYCTPVAYATDQIKLDAIIKQVARKLKVNDQVQGQDPWDRLTSLNHALTRTAGAVRFDDLRADQQARARGSWLPSAAWAGSGASSYGAGIAARFVLQLANSPIGKLLPWIPQVAPWYHAIKKGAAIAAIVSTPLAVALGVLAINQSLGTRYRKVLPLLLSIGALSAHNNVRDAHEVVAL
ncbi:MAG: hypothetical protein ACI9MC_001275 [Kiritimatiellia bacterium]|jgi:hypothetical protein